MKEFNKLFEQLAYRHDYMTVFDDFLTMSLCALSLGRMETTYKETIKRYNEKEQPIFGQLFGALIMAYEEKSDTAGSWFDPLGRFFEEHSGKFGRDAMGQFFTPECVCNFMAQITGGEDEEGERHISDPACGSGRNLIAFDRTNPRNRIRNFYYGMDLDRRCVLMCTMNMVMYGLKGVVIHMNSLSLEVFGGYRVFLPETGLGISPLSKQQCIAFITEAKQPEPANDNQPVLTNNNHNQVQLTLF